VKYWAKHWPVVVDNLLLASSQKEGQKLVFCDNLYAYGPTTNISPSSSIISASDRSKPGIRVHLRNKLQQRMNDKPESIAVVGGADFFGPYVTNASFLGDTITKAIVEGKPSPICLGSSSVIHDFCYVPDFARALYTVSINDKANGKFWICPHAIHNRTIEQIASDMARMAESKNGTVTVYGGWSVRLLGFFMGFMSAMIEMLPFWTKAYSVDDSDFCKTFGTQATSYEDALWAYIEFYRSLDSSK